MLNLIKKLLSFVLIIVFIFAVYLIAINVYTYINYTPESIVKKFTSLIENPSNQITEEEKKTLKDISQSSWFSGWAIENNIKDLRKSKENQPMTVGAIQYPGDSKKYATIDITFQNQFKDESCKKSKLYLEQYGSWYTIGSRWRIYQVDMPKKYDLCKIGQAPGNILDDILNRGKDLQNILPRN